MERLPHSRTISLMSPPQSGLESAYLFVGSSMAGQWPSISVLFDTAFTLDKYFWNTQTTTYEKEKITHQTLVTIQLCKGKEHNSYP